jgi:hypothetical protein
MGVLPSPDLTHATGCKHPTLTLNICSFVHQCNTFTFYFLLFECNMMLKYNIPKIKFTARVLSKAVMCLE